MMSLLAYRLFLDPMPVWDYWYLLIVPLCVAVAVVYKSMKCRSMKQVPREAGAIILWIIGGFSGATMGFETNPFDPRTAFHGAFSDPAVFGSKVHLLWLGVGTEEPERMHTGILAFHQGLDNAGIKHVFYESSGTAHEWQTWRRSLYQFAPLVFQD